MRGIWTVLVVIAAVGVFAVAGYVIVHQDPVLDSGKVLGVTSPVASRFASPTGSASNAPRARAVVAFLGDDYTSGVGATSAPGRSTTIVCAALGVTEANFGVAGSGYAHLGVAGNYASRIDQVVLAAPDVVVLSGGRNDIDSNLDTVAINAHAVFETLHQRLPNAVLVAVAPWWGDSVPRGALATIAVSIRQAVEAVGGTYLALPDPLLGHPGFMADLADPNNSGYAAIAAALGPKLRPLIPRPGNGTASRSTSTSS
jgi:lysophospholipase L1-like esterase